jgi:hypothetical protein
MDTSNIDTPNTETTNSDSPAMDSKKRPTVVTIAAVLLIVLSLFVAGLGIANQYGLLGGGFGNRQFVAGQFGNRNFTPPNGSQPIGPQSGGLPSDGFPGAQNNQGPTPNFTFTGRSPTGLANILRIIRPVTVALDIIILVLAVVAAVGLFLSKRWATILAIGVSVLVILLTIPSMIRIFSTVTLVENLVRILMAVAVIVLLLLPSARMTQATAETGDQAEVERVVR